jgi:hypothetical protein
MPGAIGGSIKRRITWPRLDRIASRKRTQRSTANNFVDRRRDLAKVGRLCRNYVEVRTSFRFPGELIWGAVA